MTDGFTGHQNGLIGHTISTGVVPSHPARCNAARPYSGPSGSKVRAASVPSSVGTPRWPSTVCDSGFRVIISDDLQYRRQSFCSIGFIAPAATPYPSETLFSAVASPSEPMNIVVSASANLLLNVDPSHATTPWCFGTSRIRNGGKTSGKCTCLL